MNLSFANPYYRQRVTYGMRNYFPQTFKKPTTDRTFQDVERAQMLFDKKYENLSETEKEEWSSGLKGCLNYTDLNRIEENTLFLSLVFEVDIETKSWSVGEIPTAKDYKRIKDNVDLVRNLCVVYEETPETPEEPLNTFKKYNDLEKILEDIYLIIQSNFYYYCGELYSGDSIGGLL